LFAALGRFSVRFRWPVIAGWLLATVVLSVALPSLSSVEKSSNSSFLPSSAPSVQAAALASPFGTKTTRDATFVAASGKPLTAADLAAVHRVERAMRAVPRVASVTDQGVSEDRKAVTAVVAVNLTSSSNKDAIESVDRLRATFKDAHPPADLSLHLTGSLAQNVDEQKQSSHIQTVTELLSVLFIVALLLLTFRAALAPVVALVPSIVALVAAGPVIALSSHLGVEVSDLTPILLTVLLLGAGTDYGLFLIFREREELRRGREVHEAVAVSVCKVGESITFSGLTVIGALATVAVATFGLYRGLGPALAIGIAVALVANLTLLPALLAVIGRAVFWPRIPEEGTARHGMWGAIAGKVVGKPVTTLISGLVIFGGLALSMLAYAPNGFANPPPPSNSDSARGQALLVAHEPATAADPTNILFRLPASVWNDPAVLATAERELSGSGLFASVTGPLDRDGTLVQPDALAQVHTELAASGSPAALPARRPADVFASADAYQAYRDSALYISADGRTVQYLTTLEAGSSTSTAAANAMPSVRAAVTSVATSIGATASGVDGNAAGAADVGALSGHDLGMIIPIVMLVLGLLLAIVLRSLIAPLYLVASVALSYLASLGLCVLVFVVIGGQDGINFVLPFFMFVFIMALGQDYNILVMTRIREEAHHAPIRVAVRRAVEATGTTVTSAGLILAGTFAVLTASGTTQVQQIGLGLAAGILLDTFFVRTLLVPSVAVLLGRWNWWPSHLSREDHDHDLPRTRQLGTASRTRTFAEEAQRSPVPVTARVKDALPGGGAAGTVP
jgi:putative drug exporter of the RND superfamily